MFHYIDDLMLTSDSMETLEKAVTSLVAHLQEKDGLGTHGKYKDWGYQLDF